ncbi:DUF1122 family protein [Metallosphaera cuprina]|nr:DUF1122 family protein [Metallosphaera cuprina]
MIDSVIKGKRLKAIEVSRTHISELVSFKLVLNDKVVGKCHHFSGREYYPPWLELDYDPWPRKEGLELELFAYLFTFLPSNSRFFVTYYKDEETLNLIMKGLSAADTPIGRSLLSAGFSWLKTWYFPEGGNEGGVKIQANKVIDNELRRRQLQEILVEVKTDETKSLIADLLAQGKP